MFKGKFKDIVLPDDGFLRGPFGSALKKSLFVPKTKNTYKVYEQSVVLEKNKDIGDYYISEEYFNSELKRFEVKQGDFLVSCSGVNYGEIFQLEGEIEKGVINQALLRIRLNTKIVDQNYFLYYFKSYIVKVITGGTGDSTIPNFPPMSFIKNIDIELPDMKEQIMIGNILKNIDNKIANNKKINIELEKLAKTVYNYWFLQFEFPDGNGNPYKSSHGKMIWDDSLKKMIPESWKSNSLSYFIKKEKSGDWGKEEKTGNYKEKVQCIRGADFPGLLGIGKNNAPIRYILDKNTDKKLEKNDLIIEISGGSPTQSTGRICYINQNTLKRFDTSIITSNFCKAITLNDHNYQYWFYILWKTLYENDVLFKYEGKTTGIKNLLFDMLCNDYKVITPDVLTVKKFNKKVSVLFETIQKNCHENEQLEKIQKFLLPLIMNGKINFE